MASVTNLRNGSTGDDVKKLQQALVDAGYDVGKSGVDGIYGNATAAAVKQYQKDNGLAVDGIAGQYTLGSLYGATTTTGNNTQNTTNTTNTGTNNAPATGTGNAADTTTETPAFTYDSFTYDPYAQSDTVTQANAILQQHNANKPGAYQSQWQEQINAYMDKIMNRDPFSYDVNGDALYQQYRDNYIQQGQMAMMDTMGQAAAMTGGYGNSYAQSVGQQMYNQQLNQLNDIVPELYQMAYDRYNQEGQDLYNQYGMLMDRENMDYGRYQDTLNNWYTERDYLSNAYNAEREFDYSKYEGDRSLAYDVYSGDRSMAFNSYLDAYNRERDAVADSQWQAEYDEDKRRYDQEWEENKRRYEQEYADKKAASSTSSSSSSAGYDNGDLSKDKVKKLQEILGVTVDGKWGSESSKAAGGMTADEAWEAYRNGTLGKEEEAATGGTLSAAASSFLSKLPYANAGSSAESWKNLVRNGMMAQYDQGILTDEDVMAIINKLGL